MKGDIEMVHENKTIPDDSPDKSISEPTIMLPIAAPGFTPIPVPMPKNDLTVNTKHVESTKDKD